jgi:hypothetical protein
MADSGEGILEITVKAILILVLLLKLKRRDGHLCDNRVQGPQ